jgi:hypothetical protein
LQGTVDSVRDLRGLPDQPISWKKLVPRGLVNLRDEADGDFRLLGGLLHRNLERMDNARAL